jgi:hypothetical protein
MEKTNKLLLTTITIIILTSLLIITQAAPHLNYPNNSQLNQQTTTQLQETKTSQKNNDDTGYPLMITAAILSAAITGYIVYENKKPNKDIATVL